VPDAAHDAALLFAVVWTQAPVAHWAGPVAWHALYTPFGSPDTEDLVGMPLVHVVGAIDTSPPDPIWQSKPSRAESVVLPVQLPVEVHAALLTG
jgi:hypothetical protein